MSAYNKLNGQYCSENPWLLTDVLKDEWGFQALWFPIGRCAQCDPYGKCRLDLEMPTGEYLNAGLLDASETAR